MAEFVRKNMLGAYKSVPGGVSDPQCTHVVLSKEEYDNFFKEKAVLQKKIQDEKWKVENTRQEAEKKVYRAQQEAAEKIEDIDRERQALQQKLNDEIDLNKNLKRIAKERANSDRNLRPKKQHTGYVVMSSIEKAYKYKDGRYMEVVSLWETVIQSPYEVGISEDVVRKQILKEIEEGIIQSIGVKAISDNRYEELVKNEEWKNALCKYNFMTDIRLKANYRAGYWEVVFLHTKPLERVPQEMIRGK